MKKRKHVSQALCQRMPVPFITGLLAVTAALGYDPDQLLAASGARCRFAELTRGDNPELPIDAFVRINRLCNATLRAYHARTTGETCMTEEQFRLLCRCLINGGTLRQAIALTQAFFAMFDGRIGYLWLEETRGAATLFIDLRRVIRSEAIVTLDSYGLAVMHMLYGWLIDRPIRLDSVGLACARPLRNALCLSLFDCDLHFDQAANSLCFASDYLDQPTVRTHNELAEFLCMFPFDLTLTSYRSKPLAEQVYVVMMNHYGSSHQLPSIDAVAAIFGVTSSTLRRRLAEDGSAYSKIRKRCQLNVAADFLRRADMTVDEIARLSSFSEPAAFRRAFRHWTGKSPTAYRQEMLGR
jgi:AraC-like DNA-binding protein